MHNILLEQLLLLLTLHLNERERRGGYTSVWDGMVMFHQVTMAIDGQGKSRVKTFERGGQGERFLGEIGLEWVLYQDAHTPHKHTTLRCTQPSLISTLPPFSLPSIFPSLHPFLSLPPSCRYVEQKLACNYILIFGWYLLCYWGC